MTTPAKISYAFIALILVGVCMLQLSTPFITMLFAYFALCKLRCGLSKGFAVTLFVILVAVLTFGFCYFVKQAYVALPKIAETTTPKLIEYATNYGIELPFEDYESMKAVAREAIPHRIPVVENFTTAAKAAKTVAVEIVSFLIGVVSAVSMFLNARGHTLTGTLAEKDTLYAKVWAEIAERFCTFYGSFTTVMGAQITISAINTTLTAIFLLFNGFPHITVILVLTFLCGLLPIVGNLISNTLIVGVSFTLGPHIALFALIFLVVLHKLEYFLNSKIIGHRIKNPMWLTLLGLIIGEKLMGVPGMVLAPVLLHYIKMEASGQTINGCLTDTPATAKS